MRNATIFLVEDNGLNAAFLLHLFDENGKHKVAISAKTFEKAMEIIAGDELTQLGVNIAIVDGCLPRNQDELKRKIDHILGNEVAQAIRNKKLPIKIIAFTSLPQNKALYGDAYVHKNERGRVLLGAIDALLALHSN